jgi:hypothetical protein
MSDAAWMWNCGCKSNSHVEARLWRAARRDERTQEQRGCRFNAYLTCPVNNVASMSVMHIHEHNSDQTIVLPLQAP